MKFETFVYREPMPGIEITIRVRGRYYPGTSATYWDPGDPAQLDIEECYVTDDSGRVIDPLVELTADELYDIQVDAECEYHDRKGGGYDS